MDALEVNNWSDIEGDSEDSDFSDSKEESENEGEEESSESDSWREVTGNSNLNEINIALL